MEKIGGKLRMDKEILIHKVNSNNTLSLSSDDEYYYSIGQCVQFMVKRYVGVNKLLNAGLVASPVLMSNNLDTLKRRIKALFSKTSNMLYMDDKKFNNCLAMIFSYVPENKKVNNDLIQRGFMENSILN